MTSAITFATSAAPLLPMGFVWPGCSLSYRLESAAISGPAQITEPKPERAGSAAILALVEILAAEAKHHRNLRQSRQASISEAELRDLRHRILRAGIAQRAAADRAI